MINGHDSGIWEVPIPYVSYVRPMICPFPTVHSRDRTSFCGKYRNSMEKIMGKSGEMEHPMTGGFEKSLWSFKLQFANWKIAPLYIYIYMIYIHDLYTYYDLPSSKMLMFRRWLQQKSTVIIPYHPVSLTNGERSYCSIDLLTIHQSPVGTLW